MSGGAGADPVAIRPPEPQASRADVSVLTGAAAQAEAPHGVPGLIRRRYAEHRDATVCTDEERSLTLHELELLSDALAERLRAEVADDGPVLLRLRRGVDRAVAVLAVLKAGRGYVPVDPDEPAPRLARMIALARPAATIGEGLGADGPPALAVPRRVDLRALPRPLEPVPPDQTVYVIFTSGSTGEPKGVVLGSAALCARLLWMQRRYPLLEDDRVLQKTPYTFDPSGWELLLPLIAGGRCVFAPDGAHRDPARLAAFAREHAVTVCHFVPSMLAEFLDTPGADRLTSLRHVFCSGEALTAPLARRALDTWPIELHNLYGPTEAAIDVTYWDVPPDIADEDVVPIGLPVDDTVLAVVDENGEPVPAGEPGELWIAGDQLAAGYAGRPDLTAAAFPQRHGRRWYRTGDLTRASAAGLVYLGRRDDQLKVGGVRIEPVEVEHVLSAVHPQVAVAGVPGRDGTVLLAALAGERVRAIGDARLRRHATAHLPAAMVPAGFHRISAFPLGSSGKLDRRRLAALLAEWWDGRDAVPCEATLEGIWTSVLGPAAGATTGFVSAGGNSLAAIRLVRALRRSLGVELGVGRLLHEDLSLADLRGLPAGRDAAAPSPGPALDGEAPQRTPSHSPLAPEQRRLWVLGRMHPDVSAYNVVAALRPAGRPDPDRLAGALAALCRRHDILRARVAVLANGTPQLRYEDDVAPPLHVERGDGEAPREEDEDIVRRVAAAVVEEHRAPMLRAHLWLPADGDRSLLVLVFNHLVADQESLDVVLAELAEHYATGTLDAGPAPSYARHAAAGAARIGDPRWRADLEHWRARLDGAPPELTLPFRGEGAPGRGFAGDARTARLDPEILVELERFLRRRNSTMAGFFLAVFAAVLSVWSGQRTVVIGLPSAHRRAETDPGLVGFVVDTLPIRVDLEGLATFADLLDHVRDRYTEAMDHALPPFDAVLASLPLRRASTRDAVFQVWLNDLTAAAPAPGLGELPATSVLPPVTGSLFELGLYLHRDGDDLVLRLTRALDAYPAWIARELLDQCTLLARRVVADGDIALDDLDLRTGGSRAEDAGAPPRPGPRRSPAADVEAVALRRPDAIAVSTPHGRISYAQLWRRVEEAAAGLRDVVPPGAPVTVAAARTEHLPVALLACWRAGAAPVLVDAALPAARREAARRRAAGTVPVLSCLEDPPPTDVTVADLIRRGAQLSPDRRAAAAPDGGTSHVLFTSGTTGDPLPVRVPHGPLRDFLAWYRPQFDLGPGDRFSMLAGPGHDPVLREVFGALTAGATLCVPPAVGGADIGGLADWVVAERITVLHATPALLHLLVAAWESAQADRRPAALRLICVAGAPLTWGLVRRLRRVGDADVVHGYGTTETPQLASWHRLDPAGDPGHPDGAAVPVGRGAPGSALEVRTAAGRPAAVGERGEIVVRGPNLAEGYLGDDGPSGPFTVEAGVARFHTGDLGRRDADGQVYVEGRADRRILLAGHRVELEEIEAAARRHRLVEEAITVVRTGPLGPVVTLQVSARRPLDGEDLRGFLRALLPGHAVPVAVQVVDGFPLDRNGKAVPVLDDRVSAPRRHGGPAGSGRNSAVDVTGDNGRPPAPTGLAPQAQRALAVIEETIEQVLGRPIREEENFFDAGLTSLALVQLHEVSSRELADGLPVTAMFAHPNLGALRRHLAGLDAGPTLAPRGQGPGELRRVAAARRELRRRIRAEGEAAS